MVAVFFLFVIPIKNYAHDKLKLAVYLPQSPPYMFIDPNSGDVTGILPDIIASFANSNDLQFEYKYLNRVRAEHELYDGRSDVSLLSPAWVKHPDKLVFSKPLFQTSDRFYSLTSIDNNFVLNGQTVCTREFYRYPVFDQLVDDKKVKRMDSESEVVQLRMLLSKRCDLVYMNEWIADYMRNNLYSFATIYSSSLTFDKSNGVLAFNPKWQAHLPKFNQFIDKIKKNGQLTQIIERYTKPQ